MACNCIGPVGDCPCMKKTVDYVFPIRDGNRSTTVTTFPQSNFRMVEDFHRVFGLTRNETATQVSNADRELRCKLIIEETAETLNELDDTVQMVGPITPNKEVDLKKLAKELADVLYVVYGTAVTYGINLDAVFEEVHRSNMSKLDKDGNVLRRADGKILKSDQYSEADLDRVEWRRL